MKKYSIINRAPFIHETDELIYDISHDDGVNNRYIGLINYKDNDEVVLICVEDSDMFKPFRGHAGYAEFDGVNKPIITLDRAALDDLKSGGILGKWILFHEFGHLEQGDLDDDLMDQLKILRDICNMEGVLDRREFLANCFTVKHLGKENTIKALLKMYKIWSKDQVKINKIAVDLGISDEKGEAGVEEFKKHAEAIKKLPDSYFDNIPKPWIDPKECDVKYENWYSDEDSTIVFSAKEGKDTCFINEEEKKKAIVLSEDFSKRFDVPPFEIDDDLLFNQYLEIDFENIDILKDYLVKYINIANENECDVVISFLLIHNMDDGIAFYNIVGDNHGLRSYYMDCTMKDM